MSICPIVKGQCQCQPDEGVACYYASKDEAAKLAYEAGAGNMKRVMDEQIAALRQQLEEAKANIGRLEEEIHCAEEALEAGLCDFPDAPTEFECLGKMADELVKQYRQRHESVELELVGVQAAAEEEISHLNARVRRRDASVADLERRLAEAQGQERLQSAGDDISDLCRRIDERFCGRMALMLECSIIDPNGHFDEACDLLDEYKSEWQKVNPSPPTFMGEPMPPERMDLLLKLKAARAAKDKEEQA